MVKSPCRAVWGCHGVQSSMSTSCGKIPCKANCHGMSLWCTMSIKHLCHGNTAKTKVRRCLHPGKWFPVNTLLEVSTSATHPNILSSMLFLLCLLYRCVTKCILQYAVLPSRTLVVYASRICMLPTQTSPR